MSQIPREKKYQILRAFHAGKISLTDLKVLAKLGSVAAMDEYMSAKDKKDLLSFEGGMHRLFMTRGDAKKLVMVKFKPRNKIAMNREDHIGSYYSGYHKAINWKRESYMKRKKGTKRAQPRPGSSRGKIGKTKVIGVRKAINDFEMLISSLQRLMQSGEIKPGDTKALQAKMKSIRTSITPKG